MFRVASWLPLPVSSPIHFRIQSVEPTSCCRRPVERTGQIVYPLTSLVRSSGFL